jgi:hypothetical protein
VEYTEDGVAFEISDSDLYLAVHATATTIAKVSSRQGKESLLVSSRLHF